ACSLLASVCLYFLLLKPFPLIAQLPHATVPLYNHYIDNSLCFTSFDCPVWYFIFTFQAHQETCQYVPYQILAGKGLLLFSAVSRNQMSSADAVLEGARLDKQVLPIQHPYPLQTLPLTHPE